MHICVITGLLELVAALEAGNLTIRPQETTVGLNVLAHSYIRFDSKASFSFHKITSKNTQMASLNTNLSMYIRQI